MTVLAVDLAAKYSAAVLLTSDGAVPWQLDSWGKSETLFLTSLTIPWRRTEYPDPDVIIVEDLPHRLPFASLVKQVCRMQGRIIQIMDDFHLLSRVLFIPPAEWRKTFIGLERGTGPEAVVPVAKHAGYTPPDLSQRCVKAGDKAIARKVTTDYCAAYLIARWAQTTHTIHGMYQVRGISSYGS